MERLQREAPFVRRQRRLGLVVGAAVLVLAVFMASRVLPGLRPAEDPVPASARAPAEGTTEPTEASPADSMQAGERASRAGATGSARSSAEGSSGLTVVVRDGAEPSTGYHLGLLSNYLPGYTVTYGGAVLGFLYFLFVGGALFAITGIIYNALVGSSRQPRSN